MKSLRIVSSCAAAAVAAAFLPAIASAATVVGGSDLLSAASANQLESWLGQGPLTLTNVFDKAPGSTSVDFHAAADGKGATFSIIEFLSDPTGKPFDKSVIVGGYNPQSWFRFYSYNIPPLDVDRTAFVFNLTQNLKFDQRKDASTSDRGKYQTLNHPSFGPTFGGGQDLAVAGSLNSGYGIFFSYGADGDYGRSLVTYPDFGSVAISVGQIEVFTISAAVLEPETGALMLGGLALLGLVVRRRG